MKTYNLFIVSSPLQVMNAIEAVEHFKTQNNILLILSTENTNQLTQMNQLLTFIDWFRVEYISPLTYKGINRFFFPRLISHQLKDIKNYKIDKLFVGDYRSEHLNHIVNYFQHKDVYLLDDGLNQLSYHKYILTPSYKLRIRRFIYKAFFYKLSKVKYTMFTMFTIKNEKVINNNHSFFKKYINTKIIEDKVYFIGQPLVDLKIMSEENFKKELLKVILFYSKKRFIYILHRKEDGERIKKISNEFNFEYKKFNNVIEIEMLNSKKIPSDFATFFSTAIITLPSFIKDAKYITFKSQYFNNNVVDTIEDIYKEFEERNLKVESL
ncbi:MAG TPA: hypothetical protein ENK91_09050 [Bacteroidetes bacterium]|nr:hypothetical protein [Arcobacter sp.]HHH53791.1 hypothetical protein [Bacteroidota bacterium]